MITSVNPIQKLTSIMKVVIIKTTTYKIPSFVIQDTIMYHPYYRGNMHPKESMQVKMQKQSLVPD